ncbi:MAG: glycosyltransferase family 4 protein [Bacteroidia bacterium]|nr:glycosyltransferase family 4 protein [Bacteroidia bacterium]
MPIKVLFITYISQAGSSSLAERMLIKGLYFKGIDLTVISNAPTQECSELESLGIRFEYFPITKKISFTTIARIRKILLAEKYDIMHLTYGKAITNSLFASGGIPVKIVVFFGSMSVYWHDPSAYLSFLNSRIDKIICISDNVRDHVMKQLRKKDRNKAIRIYRGFDPGWLGSIVPVTRGSLNIPEDAFVIGCVATVRKIKGIPYLINAANSLPAGLPVYFVIVGRNSDSRKIKKMAEATKYGENFRLTGKQPMATAYTAMSDLYVQPSITEGLGRAIIEAMSLCKPVIVTDNGGAKELIEEGKCGFVVPAKSSAAIAERILYCLKNRDLLKVIGENARERISSYFHIDSSVSQTVDLYREIRGKN